VSGKEAAWQQRKVVAAALRVLARRTILSQRVAGDEVVDDEASNTLEGQGFTPLPLHAAIDRTSHDPHCSFERR